MLWTTSWLPTTAGDAAILSHVSVRQATVPSRIDSALIVPRKLVMYASPSETTAGNSISVPIPRLHTRRNGGRSLICVCACVRVGPTPYIGHWRSRW